MTTNWTYSDIVSAAAPVDGEPGWKSADITLNAGDTAAAPWTTKQQFKAYEDGVVRYWVSAMQVTADVLAGDVRLVTI